MRYKTIQTGLFRKNREKISGMLDADSVAIVHSNDQMVRSGDQYYPYRQSSDFFYLTGIEQEMSVLLLCPGHKDKNKNTLLFLRKSDPKLVTWEGPKLSLDEARKISGIESVHWADDFESLSREIILENNNICCASREELKFRPDYPSRDERFQMQYREKYTSHRFSRLTPLLRKLRAVKEPEELEMIRAAVQITSDSFRRVLAMTRAGLKEFEIEAELTHEFIRQGASGHAYPPIIATGENACYLHYIVNDAILQEGQLLLMDFGAEYGNYAADCTRTIPVSGDYSARQLEIYRSCLDLFKYARSLFRPGTTLDKINEQVWKKSQEGHLQLGLYSLNDVERQPKNAPLHKKYLMHGVSHYLGLDVHDAGQIKMPLEEGMVLTCEPGIYIPEEKMGVRIENNLLITKNGCVDLMEDIPSEPDDIRNLMGSG